MPGFGLVSWITAEVTLVVGDRLHTMDDSFAILEHLSRGVRSAVIVGAGFIGVEMADALTHRGIEVTVVGGFLDHKACSDGRTPWSTEVAKRIDTFRHGYPQRHECRSVVRPGPQLTPSFRGP